MTFSVLFVCTGNICRSPVAERLFLLRLGDSAAVSAASAGVRALVGRGIDRPSARALRDLGGDDAGHRARRLEPAMVGDADLILAAESAQRDFIVRMDPTGFRRTFTMREFARLASGLPGVELTDDVELRERVGEIAARRGVVDPPRPGGDDIGDPFGAGIEVARQIAAEISDAVDAVVAGLGLPRRA